MNEKKSYPLIPERFINPACFVSSPSAGSFLLSSYHKWNCSSTIPDILSNVRMRRGTSVCVPDRKLTFHYPAPTQ
ncbi:hypothetical protein XENTR_v10012056 [Xenopus tropicalis]|nr:hypothetical protein XENTR_v10012056 [Xenopus tropicalis]